MHVINISPQPIVTIDLDMTLAQVDIAVGANTTSAKATAFARVPVVTAVRSSTVTAVKATANDVARVPVVGGANFAFVTAVVGASFGLARIPVVTGGSSVAAVPVATATATAGIPVTTSPVNVTVNAVKAVGGTSAVSPEIDGEAVLIGGGPGLSNAMAIAPVVSVVSTGSPVFASVGSNLAFSNSTAANIPVPAGVVGVPSEIIVVPFYLENVQAVTPPAGFTYEAGDQIAANAQGYRVYYFWKRPTAADTGTYNFTIAAGLTGRSGFAMRFTGCVTTGSPFGDHNTSVDADATTTTTPTMALTTGGNNRLVLWSAGNFAGDGVTPPAGMIERADNGEIALATMDMPVAGWTGNLTGTTPTATQSICWLVSLLPT